VDAAGIVTVDVVVVACGITVVVIVEAGMKIDEINTVFIPDPVAVKVTVLCGRKIDDIT
jgi:flagellar biosynthesis protein FliQ